MPSVVRWLAAIGVLVACGPALRAEAPVATAPDADPAVHTLREFFAAPDAGDRARLAAEFGLAAPKSWDAVRALLHQAATFPPLAPGRHALKTEGDAVVPAVNYAFRVPTGYASDAGRAWPLLIGLHGAGGSGEGFLATLENLLGDDAAKYLVACPDAPEGGVYKVSRMMTEYPLRVLQDVRRRANVDSDRVVLLGVSKGGYTVWGTILFSPGEWAGAVPIASWPLTEAPWASPILYAPNVLGLGVQAHWGADDILPGQKQGINTFSRQAAAELKRLGAAKFEPIEYPGQGHNLNLDDARIRTFLTGARREPFPGEFRMFFHRLWEGRAYFVRATVAAREDFDFKALPRVSVANKADLAQALCRTYQRLSFELRGLRKADENSLVVFARNLEEVEIEIGAEQMDFSRPMTVLANGRTVLSGKQKVDWVELLETARQTYDFERLVARRLRCKVEVKQ